MQTWSKSGASSLYVCECVYVHAGVYWNPHKEWMMLSLSFSSSGYSSLEEWWQRIIHLAFCTSLCAFLKVVYFPSVTDMLKFLWSTAGVFPLPRPPIPFCLITICICSGLVATGRSNASENEKFLYAETLCMPVLPQTREVTVVWRPYIPVQEAVFTMWLQGILARSRALSVQWWQYWKINKKVIAQTLKCFIHPEVKWVLYKLSNSTGKWSWLLKWNVT